MLNYQSSDKDYMSNLENKWTDDEEIGLLEESNKNTEIETISQDNNRTIETEIAEMKHDIKELQNTINLLLEMMKSVYEFKSI